MVEKEIITRLSELEQEISMLQTALEEKQREYEMAQEELSEEENVDESMGIEGE